ncbi:hypothetical protein HanRHA438_Chr12g0564661 [Helianthus annuus]|uniref:Uncharacterized protein n=1 Tax=Helianthus annuus TaxID=4232 RepID=A0A9K3HIF6_HELAN|nr:hypothetical protein HanXRQr2_Chr12g0553361 [Helianthus annuus]KAJ0494426.1 hypothetical protein HanIR_Chr12g0597351 [Helianthus annuus]KAJ0863665.1 hypothetical protein HanPSC8_Chr12g0532691 [Helianthus annuus]KAJ0867564.1 hypothetical protein HanRHA438_Chr12g0564661 [Helianthus annuus]
MSKLDPVPVPNRYRWTGDFFGTDSVPTFDIFGTGSVLDGTELIPIVSAAAISLFLL